MARIDIECGTAPDVLIIAADTPDNRSSVRVVHFRTVSPIKGRNLVRTIRLEAGEIGVETNG